MSRDTGSSLAPSRSVWEHSEKAAVSKPGNEPPSEPPMLAPDLDFQPPGLRKASCCLNCRVVFHARVNVEMWVAQ